MRTSSPPHPALDLSTHLSYQLGYTFTGLLPLPLDDTLEVLRSKNHPAVPKVAALLPVAERFMLGLVDPKPGSLEEAWSKAAPAACMDQRHEDNASYNGTNSQGVAFETLLSEQPWN